ncbi:redoxin domain-containing protein [Bacillus tamaricis]|uniref:Redoxin domain-containing protein n=1 Tax=Evansella tamaricis TaxID=2069301 RepID=A0ABS6JCY4_9BACI|nr:redoxin domain-containing protein [Evansella tamaricis]
MDSEVLAISVDHIYAHNVFAASLGTLPYPLLSDWHKETAKKYNVFHEKNETAIRSVFVVNKEGQLAFRNTSFDAQKKEDYNEVFSELEKLNERK